MLAFQEYQTQFTAHIRNPNHSKKPDHVNNKRMAVYREIVFNNFFSSVSACFPVLHDILGKRRFKQLVRNCFFQQHFTSPFFREIPKAFVDFLAQYNLKENGLPAFTAQLAHYEWAELYISALNTKATEYDNENVNANLLDHQLGLTPAHLLVQYDYPVHTLSKKHQPTAQTPTFLLLYRNPEFTIKFIQLNPLTFELLHIIHRQSCTGREALQQIAAKTPALPLEAVMTFGQVILQDLVQQRALNIRTPTN
jgi:hypothetical protein